MRQFKRAVILIATAVILAGCSSSAPPPPPLGLSAEEIELARKSEADTLKELEELQQIRQEEYRILPGDKFDFRVYDNDDLNMNSVMVMPDGSISVGLAGVVKIGGMTVAESQKTIEERLQKYIRSPKATLILTDFSSSSFTIIGKVGDPNRYSIKKLTRLNDAIAMAKGFPTGMYSGKTIELADLEHAFIVRNGKVLPVNFIEAIRKGNPLHNIPIKDGDYIYIPSTMSLQVFVLGDVPNPIYVGYQEGLSVIQAISYANGTLDTASSDALVIRGSMTSPTVYKVDLDDILHGRATDFPLKPYDIVFVKRGGLSEYNTFINKLMPTLILLNLMAGPFGTAQTLIMPTNSGSSGGSAGTSGGGGQ